MMEPVMPLARQFCCMSVRTWESEIGFEMNSGSVCNDERGFYGDHTEEHW